MANDYKLAIEKARKIYETNKNIHEMMMELMNLEKEEAIVLSLIIGQWVAFTNAYNLVKGKRPDMIHRRKKKSS